MLSTGLPAGRLYLRRDTIPTHCRLVCEPDPPGLPERPEDMAADHPISDAVTIPEVITLVHTPPFVGVAVVEASGSPRNLAVLPL